MTQQLVTNKEHSSSPTRFEEGSKIEVNIQLKTNINWDFHERFPNSLKPSQNYVELDGWLQWIINEWDFNRNCGARRFKYLEIGSYAGESLYYVSQVLPRGSTLVLCDLGDNTAARKILYDVMGYVVNTYNHYVPLISGDSTNPETVKRITDIDEKYDLVFIDGNHSFNISSKDYANYGPLGNRVAFHDISIDNIERDKLKYPPYGQPLVSHLWQSIKLVVSQKHLICEVPEATGEPLVEENPYLDNWSEIIDNTSGLKPRGFGIIYGGKFV